MKREAFLRELQWRIETATDRLIAEAAGHEPPAAGLATKPVPTGSLLTAITIGMV